MRKLESQGPAGAGRSQIFVDRQPCLVRQLKANWPTGFLLLNSCAVHCVAARRYTVDVAAAQLVVDREVEQREIPLATLNLQLGSDRPDATWPQRRLRADEFASVPR